MGTRGEAALWGKFTYNEATLRYLTSSLDSTLKRTGDSLTLLQKSLDSLAEVAFNNHRALDYLLASQGGVCAVINKTCCIYINVTGEVKVNVQEIYEQASWIHRYNQGKQEWTETLKGWFPGYTWLLPFLGPSIFLIFLLGPCIFNHLAKCLSSRIQQLQLQMMLCQGFQPIPPEDRDHQHPLGKAAASFYSPLSISATLNNPRPLSLTEKQGDLNPQVGTAAMLSLKQLQKTDHRPVPLKRL